MSMIENRLYKKPVALNVLAKNLKNKSEVTFSVLDRIGTGDAYTSGIIHGELKGFSSQETGDFATTAGMLAYTIVGDTPLSTESDILRSMVTM